MNNKIKSAKGTGGHTSGTANEWLTSVKVTSMAGVSTNPAHASNGDGTDHKTVREVTAEPLFTVDEVADLFDTSIDDILDREDDHQIDWILDDDLEKVYPFSEVHRLEDVYGPSHKLWEAYPYFNKTASRSSDFPRRA